MSRIAPCALLLPAVICLVVWMSGCCPPGTHAETTTETHESVSVDENGNVVVKVEVKTVTKCVPDRQEPVPNGPPKFDPSPGMPTGMGLASGAINPSGSDFKFRFVTARNIGPIGNVQIKAHAYTPTDSGPTGPELFYEGPGVVVARTGSTIDVEAVEITGFDAFIQGTAQMFQNSAIPGTVEYEVSMVAANPPANLSSADITNVVVTAMGYVVAW